MSWIWDCPDPQEDEQEDREMSVDHKSIGEILLNHFTLKGRRIALDDEEIKYLAKRGYVNESDLLAAENEIQSLINSKVEEQVEARIRRERSEAIKSYKKVNKLLENEIRIDEVKRIPIHRDANGVVDQLMPVYQADRLAALQKQSKEVKSE